MNTDHSISTIAAILQSHGHPLDTRQESLLRRYVELLLDWNSKINLISRKDQEQVWRNHILHSLAAMLYIDFPTAGRIVDIGSGGGLPGIPLAIMLPEVQWTLVDSVGKKIRVVAEIAATLELSNIRTLNGRIEDENILRDVRETADVVTARAVTRLEALVRWTRPLLAPKGMRKLVVWKGGDLSEELQEARRNPTISNSREIQIDLQEEQMFTVEQKKLVEIVYR